MKGFGSFTPTVKEKKKGKIRSYDSERYTRRAGCLCFRTEHEEEILLVTSSRQSDKWIVPSGGVDPGESSQEAAVREVMEEAGVLGRLGRSLGTFQNDTNRSRTALYVLTVVEELNTWQDAEKGRKRKWFPISKAWNLLSHSPAVQRSLTQAHSMWQRQPSPHPSFDAERNQYTTLTMKQVR